MQARNACKICPKMDIFEELEKSLGGSRLLFFFDTFGFETVGNDDGDR